MSAVKPVIPWVVDPLGTLVTTTTGIPTPGGVVNRQLNPPRRATPAPDPRQPTPTPPTIAGPRIVGRRVPPRGVAPPTPSDKSGATPGTDATRGLLKKPRPTGPQWSPGDQHAVSNALVEVARGDSRLAQQALDYLEDGPADRLPEPPPGYTPPDQRQTLETLQCGCGEGLCGKSQARPSGRPRL